VARVASLYGDLTERREKAFRALRQFGPDAIAMEDTSPPRDL
jgi:hypothetical protein